VAGPGVAGCSPGRCRPGGWPGCGCSPGFNPAGYEQQPIDEFDQLYAEGATRRWVMVIGLQGRISGHASRVRTLARIFTRLRGHDDVW
jgi:hypothetical protein